MRRLYSGIHCKKICLLRNRCNHGVGFLQHFGLLCNISYLTAHIALLARTGLCIFQKPVEKFGHPLHRIIYGLNVSDHLLYRGRSVFRAGSLYLHKGIKRRNRVCNLADRLDSVVHTFSLI